MLPQIQTESLFDKFLQDLGEQIQPTGFKPSKGWPVATREKITYRNRETGKVYRPHNEEEWRFLLSDEPRNVLLKGGWGSGKSTAGIIKALERLRRGCSGIMVSPDNPHFERSLWLEFERWVPWDQVIYHNQTKKLMRFRTGAVLIYGGIENPADWEGPNVNWALFDEARKKKDPEAMKVLMSRVRLMGPAQPGSPNGIPPQLVLDTTPRKHWLFEYFGPEIENDPRLGFKRQATSYTLKTSENLVNLDAGYVINISSGLTEAEQRVNLEAEWEDIDDIDRFLPSITHWDLCREALPPLGPREPMVIALDAGVSDDDFGMLGTTRHPRRHEDVAVRFVQKWSPPRGGSINYDGTESDPGPRPVLRRLCKIANVVQVCYDRTELHDFVTGLGYRGEGIAWFKEFSQGADRAVADKQFRDLILQRRIAHEGDPDLRQQIENADRKTDADTRHLRIVKREQSLKIDLAVCASMGSHEALRLDL